MRALLFVASLFCVTVASAHVHKWTVVENDDREIGECELVCDFTGQLHVIHLTAGNCPPRISAVVTPHPLLEDQPFSLVEEQPQEDISLEGLSL